MASICRRSTPGSYPRSDVGATEIEGVDFNDEQCTLTIATKIVNYTSISTNMAVIGSTLGFPSIQDLISFKITAFIFSLFFVVGIIWLMVDYARMLRLHRKMVRDVSVLFKRS
jgi:hypothetical protein